VTSTSTLTSTSSIQPRAIWSNTHDVRSLAFDGHFLWVATSGGLERYASSSAPARFFGTVEGLDTLDVRLVRMEGDRLVAETGTGRCELGVTPRFTCSSRTPRAAPSPSKDSFEGHAVTARLSAFGGTAIGTHGAGVFFVPPNGASRRLSSETMAPASFAHTSATYRGALWLGTFRDGLVRVALDRNGKLPSTPAELDRAAAPVVTPFRMVNQLAEVDGALFVAANEGFFVTRDGHRFELVPAIGARAITSVATDSKTIWVASTGAMYRIDRPSLGVGRVRSAHLAPAGTRSIQRVVPDGAGGAWLSTEDRGIVRFDGASFQSWDRLAGLPTSWFVNAATDGEGGLLAATLRHGFLRVRTDGSWTRIDDVPGDWGLTAQRVDALTCFGAQEGAACGSSASDIQRLGALPDPRVHLFAKSGSTLLVGTEAGIAIY
jgi:ligand-binding sensor domain-containing protein